MKAITVLYINCPWIFRNIVQQVKNPVFIEQIVKITTSVKITLFSGFV